MAEDVSAVFYDIYKDSILGVIASVLYIFWVKNE